MPERVWKPLDVGGLRLYDVILHCQWTGETGTRRKHYPVLARSPSHAAKLVEGIYRETYDNNQNISCWYVTGHALNILMPAEWWEMGAPCTECKPERCNR